MTRRSQLHELALLRLADPDLVTNLQRLSEEMGVERSSLSRSLHALADEGLATHLGRSWELTERGRILVGMLRASLPQKIAAARRKRDRVDKLLANLEKMGGRA